MKNFKNIVKAVLVFAILSSGATGFAEASAPVAPTNKESCLLIKAQIENQLRAYQNTLEQSVSEIARMDERAVVNHKAKVVGSISAVAAGVAGLAIAMVSTPVLAMLLAPYALIIGVVGLAASGIVALLNHGSPVRVDQLKALSLDMDQKILALLEEVKSLDQSEACQ